MDFFTFGKPENPALLLIPDRGMDYAALHEALRGLERAYFLIFPAFDGPETVPERAELLEKRLLDDFSGRIWGAYGLGAGGEALLTLLSRKKVRIRTSVAEGALALPAASLRDTPGRLVCWYGTRDRQAKKSCRALRADVPGLRTVALKKLRAGQSFPALRPDLMTKRLERTFGRGRTVRLSTVMDRDADRIWKLLCRRETPRAARRLTETEPPVQDAENRVCIVEGRGKAVRLWSHLVRLEPLSGTETVYTDQVELSAGPLTGAAALWTKLYLRRGQRRWKKELRADKRKPWLD